jgi:hypothetical protein
LPPSWRTLYELSKLDDQVLRDKIGDHSIHPEMERGDVAMIAASIAKPKVTKTETIEVKVIEAERETIEVEVTEAEWPKSLPKSSSRVTEAEIIEQTPTAEGNAAEDGGGDRTALRIR